MPVILILAMLWLVGLVWTLWAVEFFRHHQGRFPDFDPDTVLYRRLLEQSIDRGRPVKIDTYQNFPNGVSLQFPPFYLKILLWTVWGFFALFPRASIDPELIAGTLPVIAFVGMNALILWRIWRKTRNLAVASLVAFGALPGFPQNTVFRFIGIDHHWLEVSCIWLIILMAAEFEDSRWDGWKVGGGICTALFIGVWMGSPLWHAILAAYATVLCLFGAREPARAFAEFAASSMLIGGALMCIHGIWYPPTQGYWIMHQYSWLQPSLAVGAGMWCHLLHGLLSRGLVKHLWVFVGLGVLLVGGAMVLDPGLAFTEATNFLFRKNFLISTISEMGPFMPWSGRITILSKWWPYLFERFGIAVFFLPLLFFPEASWVFSGGNRHVRNFLLLFFLLMLLQVRFCRWFACGTGIFIGVILYQFVHCFWKALQTAQIRPFFLGLLCLPLLFIQSTLSLTNNWSSNRPWNEMGEAMDWLREKTPPTSGYSADDAAPEYGVMSFWDKGNFISFFGRRPSVVANTLLGYRLQAEILTAESEEEAFRLFRNNRIRYLLIAPDGMDPAVHDYMNQLKRSTNPDSLVDLSATTIGSATWRSYAESFDTWVRWGMTFQPTGQFPTTPTRFRWVYLSKNWQDDRPVIRILEAVPGAVLRGKADPGTPVEIRLSMHFGAYPITFVAKPNTDSSGRFEVRVPYSTSYIRGRIRTAEACEVKFTLGGTSQKVKIEVPESAVLNEEVIAIAERSNSEVLTTPQQAGPGH